MKSLQKHINERFTTDKSNIMQSGLEKDLLSINDFSEHTAELLNRFYNEKLNYKENMVFCSYVYNDSQHLFIKTKGREYIQDEPLRFNNDDHTTYDIIRVFRYMQNLKLLNDFLCNNIFMYFCKWNYIDTSSRINNHGRTAYQYLIPRNGVLLNSSKEANKFIRLYNIHHPYNNKPVHTKSLLEVLDLYERASRTYSNKDLILL